MRRGRRGTFEIAGVQFVIRADEHTQRRAVSAFEQLERTYLRAVRGFCSYPPAWPQPEEGRASHDSTRDPGIGRTWIQGTRLRGALPQAACVAKSLARLGTARRARARFWPEKRKEGIRISGQGGARDASNLTIAAPNVAPARARLSEACASDSEARCAGWVREEAG